MTRDHRRSVAHGAASLCLKVVLDVHLLQFGMLIGESSAELAIGQRRAAHATTLRASEASDCLYGLVDCPERYAGGWERIVEEHKPGLHYWVCRWGRFFLWEPSPSTTLGFSIHLP